MLTFAIANLLVVFFAHCHPQRYVIHKPTFTAALSHNRIPNYLLNAVCALAAPLSKNPILRTSQRRIAGSPYTQDALAEMFDRDGQLLVEPNLVTVQALVLLQSVEMLTVFPWTVSTKYDSALSFLWHPYCFEFTALCA